MTYMTQDLFAVPYNKNKCEIATCTKHEDGIDQAAVYWINLEVEPWGDYLTFCSWSCVRQYSNNKAEME